MNSGGGGGSIRTVCGPEDRFVQKNLFAALSISANDCQLLAHDLPCKTPLQGEI